MTTDYISIGQAAEMLGKPYYHVHRLIRLKKVKAKKVGWAWLIRRSTVLQQQKKQELKSTKSK